jgi:D-beta-D-heptose 7-phosphate kinase / D-beta-D-heptose 1-phosphate adenosyltransferase
MNNELLRLVDRFAGLRVAVIGEAMLDVYAEGEVSRLCREAPVPVVSIAAERTVPGGAANTAANLASLGAQVRFLSVTGDDYEGRVLRRALEAAGVPTGDLLAHAQRSSLVKRRILGGGQMLLRIDMGDVQAVNGALERTLLERMASLFEESDLVIVSDYGYGILTPTMVEALAACQRTMPRLLVVDSKDLALYQDVGVTVAKPNYSEALRLLGRDPAEQNDEDRLDLMRLNGHKLLEATGAEIVAVTLDRDGAIIFETGGEPHQTYAQPRPNSHASGAGDTFVSAFGLALASGAHTHAAAELASAATALVVERNGTTTCAADELRAFFSSLDKHIEDPEQLRATMDIYRRQGKRLVFTNGCFDILHRGHIAYLNRAKEQGDILVVGVNSDASVARLKGPERPINVLEDRIQVLAALSCIDQIVSFEEDTPEKLLRIVRPDVFVKGGDYTRETLPEASLVESLGGRVEILPYIQDRSTTSIIERIRHACQEQAEANLQAA